MKKLLNEFKEFALRGNVVDLAVGVIIGGAFTGIVNSLVSDIFTPIISLLTGSTNFEQLVLELKPATETQEALVLRYGSFLDAIINFTIIAFVVFMLIKTLNRVKREKHAEEAAEPAPVAKSEEVLLLQQIVDELKKK